jgi:hypothetical protein
VGVAHTHTRQVVIYSISTHSVICGLDNAGRVHNMERKGVFVVESSRYKKIGYGEKSLSLTYCFKDINTGVDERG